MCFFDGANLTPFALGSLSKISTGLWVCQNSAWAFSVAECGISSRVFSTFILPRLPFTFSPPHPFTPSQLRQHPLHNHPQPFLRLVGRRDNVLNLGRLQRVGQTHV